VRLLATLHRLSPTGKISARRSDCTKLVQRAKTPVLTGAFEPLLRLFHTVFNKTVENFHQKFIEREYSRDASG
jgi:hypothetical protein